MSSSNKISRYFLRTFRHLVDDEQSNPENLTLPDINFSRNRKLSLEEIFRLPYRLDTSSLSVAIPHLFASYCPEVSPAAVSSARSKIRPFAYHNVYTRFNDLTSHKDIRRFKGCRILAVDGSEIPVLPDRIDPLPADHSKKGSTRCFYHLNAEYDVLNRTFDRVVLQPGSQKNEDAAFLDLALSATDNVIYTADRGYEALMSFYRLNKANKRFVIRIKDEESATSLLKYYSTPDLSEYDIPFRIILTSKVSA